MKGEGIEEKLQLHVRGSKGENDEHMRKRKPF